MLIKTDSIIDEEYIDWIENSLNKYSHLATEVPTDSKVMICHGENVSDEIGLRFVAFLLKNKNIQFEEVNVTEYSRYIESKLHDLQNEEIPYVITDLAAMYPELALDALQMKKIYPI